MNTKDRIREFLLRNVGKVVTHDEIRAVALGRNGQPVSEWARRLRELRNEEGFQIHSHKDEMGLKPNEYRLASVKPQPAIARRISKRLRVEILERNGFTCQICGAGPGDADAVDPARRTRLVIDHIVPIEQGGGDSRDNLRVLCSACNSGRANLNPARESVRDILGRIRRLPKADREELYEKLAEAIAEWKSQKRA